jgi:hypothetical protein
VGSTVVVVIVEDMVERVEVGIGGLYVRERHFVILKARKDVYGNDCEGCESCEGCDNAVLVAM